MPPIIFDLLEHAFLAGRITATIPEAEYMRMITQMQLDHGCQSN
jgi:hypothetical protein